MEEPYSLPTGISDPDCPPPPSRHVPTFAFPGLTARPAGHDPGMGCWELTCCPTVSVL